MSKPVLFSIKVQPSSTATIESKQTSSSSIIFDRIGFRSVLIRSILIRSSCFRTIFLFGVEGTTAAATGLLLRRRSWGWGGCRAACFLSSYKINRPDNDQNMQKNVYIEGFQCKIVLFQVFEWSNENLHFYGTSNTSKKLYYLQISEICTSSKNDNFQNCRTSKNVFYIFQGLLHFHYDFYIFKSTAIFISSYNLTFFILEILRVDWVFILVLFQTFFRTY